MQPRLGFLVIMVMNGVGVPEEYLRSARDVACSADDLHVANEATSGIAVAAVVDVGGVDVEAAGVVSLLSLRFFRRSTVKVAVEG